MNKVVQTSRARNINIKGIISAHRIPVQLSAQINGSQKEKANRSNKKGEEGKGRGREGKAREQKRKRKGKERKHKATEGKERNVTKRFYKGKKKYREDIGRNKGRGLSILHNSRSIRRCRLGLKSIKHYLYLLKKYNLVLVNLIIRTTFNNSYINIIFFYNK